MLPDSYGLLYPGRFLKAGMLLGKKVTLTIKNIDIEELIGDKNKAEPKVIVSFVERPLEYVMPKTNGFCLKRMFGNNPHDWIGKQITWFGTTCKFGREDVDCLRIWGSPSITEDMPITIPQGRKKPLEMVMHKVAQKGAPKPSRKGLDPRILAGLGILSEKDADAFLAANAELSPVDMLAALNRLIDEAA